MNKVKAKKHLGQHFLNDESIAQKIVNQLDDEAIDIALEIGPGMGVLTKYLAEKPFKTFALDIDKESIEYLIKNSVLPENQIIYCDFLKENLQQIAGKESFAVIGNFPYNISTQIMFKILEYKDQIPIVVGMFQKEVAERMASKQGSKVYGITSVLLQAFYQIDYLFTVPENVFTPPPKVKSAVIKLKRNAIQQLDCDEKFFKTVVKTAFNQRRKTLRNSLKQWLNEDIKQHTIFNKRPEQLSVQEFVELTNLIS
ncbi:MAG: 16S rRNA (adenine(1518)-N(6)/adenine(1519)-N(6)) -dimethyltransferase RsmA [Vicingaceae bacterium]